MNEHHVIGNQKVTGNFKLYVMFNNSNDWTLWKSFNDLEDCYSERWDSSLNSLMMSMS